MNDESVWEIIAVTQGGRTWYELRKSGDSALVLNSAWGGTWTTNSIRQARKMRDKLNREDAEGDERWERVVP